MGDPKPPCEDILNKMKNLEKLPLEVTARRYQRLTIEYTLCKVVEAVQILSQKE